MRKWTPEVGRPILIALLERGYDPIITYNGNEDAPLLIAAKKGDHELVSLLSITAQTTIHTAGPSSRTRVHTRP
jgi:hypothetical protein